MTVKELLGHADIKTSSNGGDILHVALLVAVAIGALAIRVVRLDQRPLHHDEANQAVRMGILLDSGEYRYDALEHHGPTLYYLGAGLARLTGVKSFADMTEWRLRLVPALFGAGLVLLLLLTTRGLGTLGALLAGLFTAISPAMVYYSRFFIQETLLVFFALGAIGCGWRYACSPRTGWAAACGACVGLMHATKETSLLAWAAMVGALLVLAALEGRGPLGERCKRLAPKGTHFLLGAAVAAGLSITFYSSFFTNWKGVLDSVATYGTYFGRASGEGRHVHPSPWFYLHRLLWYQEEPGPRWTEGIVFLLALVAMFRSWSGAARRDPAWVLVRFLTVYTLLLTSIYSSIPYKTPWCMLSFWHGFVILAGAGAAQVLRWPGRRWVRWIGGGVLLFGCLHLYRLSRVASHRYGADRRNPYAYVPTVADFLRLPARIDQVAAASGIGEALRIHVIGPPESYWPLPWYLRRYPLVGYWPAPSGDAIRGNPDVVVVAPELAQAVEDVLPATYVTEFYGLRPNVLVVGMVREDRWARMLRSLESGGQ